MRELTMKDLYDGEFYHICTEGLQQITLLKDDEDYRIAWNYLAFSAWRAGVQLVAFVLMSNHIHELIVCNNASQAEKSIRLFKQLLSTYLRNKYGLSKVMHSSSDSVSLIDSIQYLRNCIAYIFRNPVAARICAKPEDYRWSSYRSSMKKPQNENFRKVSDLGFTMKRELLRTGMDLSSCPMNIDEEGYVTLDSFIRNDIVSKTFWNSGKSFLYYIGCCNDSKMEYELVYQPLMNVSDTDMSDIVAKYISERFRDKSVPELTTSEKCSILKSLFFNHRTTVPQLSRIMGLPRELVRKILFQ